MPYIPEKDRPIVDAAVDKVASVAVAVVTSNKRLKYFYELVFADVANIVAYSNPYQDKSSRYIHALADTIRILGHKYGYDGAELGILNYAITRLIQVVPQKLVGSGVWEHKNELRYWIYAYTVDALIKTSIIFAGHEGVGGVFEDVKDEYKRRVNTAYEAAQIIKSGDCYDTPYHTRLVEIYDASGKLIGYQELMITREMDQGEGNYKLIVLPKEVK